MVFPKKTLVYHGERSGLRRKIGKERITFMPFVVMLRLVTNWSSFTGKSRKPIILIQFATLKVWLWKIFIINTKQGKNYVNWCYLTFNIRLARPLSRTSRRFKQRWQSNSRFVNILIQLIDQHIIQTLLTKKVP